MKTLISALLFVFSISTAAQADYAYLAGDYVCRGEGCALQNELETITVEDGLFPLVTCYSPSAGTSVGVFISVNVFTCYGSAAPAPGGLYFRFKGFHWYKLPLLARDTQKRYPRR